MAQLLLQLTNSPQTLTRIFQQHLSISPPPPLITSPLFLNKVSPPLIYPHHAPFYLQHIFNKIRPPTQHQLPVVEQFLQQGGDQQAIGIIARQLLDETKGKNIRGQRQVIEGVANAVSKGDRLEVDRILSAKMPVSLQNFKSLVQTLIKNHQKPLWTCSKTITSLTKLLSSVFEQTAPASHPLLAELITKLIEHHLKTSEHELSFLILVCRISKNHELGASLICRSFESRKPNTTLPYCRISDIIFKAYQRYFNNEWYYDSKNSEGWVEIVSIAKRIFTMLQGEVKLTEMGLLGILGAASWQEGQLFITVSLLRERHCSQQSLVHQILVQMAFDMSVSGQNWKSVQQRLSVLTVEELKYLMLRLQFTLTVPQQIEWVENVSAKRPLCGWIGCFLAQYLIDHQSNFPTETARQLQASIERTYRLWQQDGHKIISSRYCSTLQQIQVLNFRAGGRILGSMLGKRWVHHVQSIGIRNILLFYKGVLLADQLAQNYWQHSQHLPLWYAQIQYEHPLATVEAVCEFTLTQKCFNLTTTMLLTWTLKRARANEQIDRGVGECLSIMTGRSLEGLKREQIPSNLLIYLQFAKQVSRFGFIRLEQYTAAISKVDLRTNNGYGRVHNLVESTIISLVEPSQPLEPLTTYLPYRQMLMASIQSPYLHHPNELMLKIHKLYPESQLPSSTLSSQNTSKIVITSWLTTQLTPKNIPNILKSIPSYFQLASPVFQGEVVMLNYIKHSPEDNYFFRNNTPTHILMEFARIVSIMAGMRSGIELPPLLFRVSMQLLKEIIESGQTTKHGQKFYKDLLKAQIASILLTPQVLRLLPDSDLLTIVETCLSVTAKDNYPLLRQYITITLCRAYFAHNHHHPNHLRAQFISKLKVSLNSGVPIILTLGYQLILSITEPERYSPQQRLVIKQTHKVLVKFVSCHTAYLRGICQYYLYKFLDLVEIDDDFLKRMRKFWQEDAGSIKILRNIGIVIEGFKVGVQGCEDFLGYERVEEYPTNRLKMSLCSNLLKLYNTSIKGQVRCQGMDQTWNSCVDKTITQRYNQLKEQHDRECKKFREKPEERTVKDNTRTEVAIMQAPPKKYPTPPKQSKSKKQKNQNKKKLQQKIIQPDLQMPEEDQWTPFQTRMTHISSVMQWQSVVRSDPNPRIIVLATLLEKVHNFGHILRTLHGKNAMLVVPSAVPLDHQECKDLVPENCDVQIVQIRRRDLEAFIYMIKNQGYPMVGLEQCSRSVSVEEARFPEKFMLLLGNQRIGAPSSLLNQADLLVQIPQRGKIRSLNVHVSMVVCLWQSLVQRNQ